MELYQQNSNIRQTFIAGKSNVVREETLEKLANVIASVDYPVALRMSELDWCKDMRAAKNASVADDKKKAADKNSKAKKTPSKNKLPKLSVRKYRTIPSLARNYQTIDYKIAVNKRNGTILIAKLVKDILRKMMVEKKPANQRDAVHVWQVKY